MMRTPLLGALVMASALFLTACGGGGADVDLTATDSTTEITVAPGDRIRVLLDANPTTGYTWEIDEMTTPGIVELESSSYEPDAGIDGAPLQPGGDE